MPISTYFFKPLETGVDITNSSTIKRKNMKANFTIIVILFLGLKVFGTAQYPDKIIYNGKMYKLQSNPLEVYFKNNPDKKPESEIRSSALWRGYVATFEVKDTQLFLKDIEIQYQDTTSKEKNEYKWRSVINEVFPNQKDIKVDWMTGLLVLPHGKLVNYVHMGYSSKYENYILLEIDKGNLKKEKHFKYKNYERFKKKQFKAFKQTEDYKKIKADMQKKGKTQKFIDSFLRNFITEYTFKILI